VDASDALLARTNPFSLRLLNVNPLNFAPDTGPSLSPSVTIVTSPSPTPSVDAATGVTSTLASAATSSPSLNIAPIGTSQWLAGAHASVNLSTGSPARYFESLGSPNASASKALLEDIDPAADELGLDDAMLDSLLADLGLE
jgi:hypothetical protein